MSNVLRYKGYAARVVFDADDRIFVGTIAGISDGVSFHANTVTDLEAAFREAVDDYVETCAKVGKAPQRPYSGSLQFRVSPELHATVARAAELSGKSLNQWGEEVLRRAAEQAAA